MLQSDIRQTRQFLSPSIFQNGPDLIEKRPVYKELLSVQL